MGQYWLSRARNEKDSATRNQHLKTAQEHYGAAWELNDTHPEVYAMYGRSLLLEKRYEKSLDTLETAHELLPHSRWSRLYLARAYLRVGRTQDARTHAQAVYVKSVKGSWFQLAAENLLAKIESAETDAAQSP